MTDLKIGDLVVCVNNSPFKGATGTILDIDASGRHHISWETTDSNARLKNGGWWGRSAIKLYSGPGREEALEAAVQFAQSVFEEYADQHLAKGEGGLFKAQTNFGFAAVMSNALKIN